MVAPPSQAKDTPLLAGLWSRTAVIALAHLPLVLVVLLYAPALLIFPFWKKRHCFLRNVVRDLHAWSNDILDRCLSGRGKGS